MVPSNRALKRPGAYGSTESSPKRLCSSPDASSVGASPLSSNTNSSFLGAQYSPYDENQHYAQTEEDGDCDMIDAHENSDAAHVEQDSINEDIICYGAILCDARPSLQVPSQLVTVCHNAKRFNQFAVVRVGQFYAVSLPENTKPFAHLDRRTCIALQSLDSIPNITVQATIDSEQLKQIQNKSKPKPGKQASVSINVHGPYRLADQVDGVLSRTSTFLQHPIFLEGSCQYFNPQMFRSGTEMENLTHLVGLTESELKAKVLSDEVEGIFDSLGDFDFHTPRESITATRLQTTINTGLMSHQTEALKFIQIREDHNWCQAAQGDLRILTKIAPGDAVPSYATGGILADAMGLGKTLTMLSAIVSTAEHARMWARSPGVDTYMTATEPRCRTRATLIVVTSIQVLNVWEAEIDKHIKPSALKMCVFHGKTRSTTPDQVTDHDLVLTTYGLLVSDFKNHRVLQKIEWYRVVLDEAHWIRNQGSDQFKAAHNLNSVRRWCLTGTPIQNRLDDLVALLSFLHFQPFARNSIFRQHILEPLAQESPDRTLRLKALLRTVCLRRNERLLNLPKSQDREISIDLDPDERLLYNEILKKCARDIDDVISNQVKIKRYSILFTAIMRLRRVCNHGTHNIGNVWVPQADSVENDCEFCGGPANEDTLSLANIGDICPQCGRSLLTTAVRQILPQTPQPVSPRPPLELPSSPQHGLSTKLQALVDNIIKSPYGSKSLVFSYWTSTLDILERHLQQRGVSYLRIDGKVPYKNRLDVLERFKTSSAADIPVLLMSIQTGAVGLNLTVANYVHIVEPQWNPSVEEQAIARAVRLGQERTVTIVRYIVKKSIEANILNLQRKKRSLAKFTLDTGTSGSGDAFSGGLEDLKFVLDFDSL